jgi:hypothetical protein
LDLSRIAIAIHDGSFPVADRFSEEAKKYSFKFISSQKDWKNLLVRINITLGKINSLEKAEDCLMYSVLLQNRANLL